MKGIGGNQEDILTIEKFAGVEDRRKERTEFCERLAQRIKVKEKRRVEISGGSREEREMTTYVHCPIDDAKTLKPIFHVEHLDLPEGRMRYA